MNNSKAVKISAIIGKIASITGYVIGGLSLLIIINGILDWKAYGAAEAVVIFLIILALCILLIYKGVQIKKRIKRLNKYVSLIYIEQISSLENIAAGTSQSVDFVCNDLRKMIDKKLIVGAYIDMNTYEVVASGRSYAASWQEPLQGGQTGGEAEPVNSFGCGASSLNYFASNNGLNMESNDVSPKKERQPNPYAITSLFLAIVPVIILLVSIVFFVLVADGTLFGGVGGGLWPVFLILGPVVLMIGIIADILAVIFGIIAIVKRKTFFSWLGIIIVAIEALILVI